MPDIAMCKNKSCPSSDKCRRFTATPSEPDQWYNSFKVVNGENKCSKFWPNDNHKP